LLPVSRGRADGRVALETVSYIRDHRTDGAPGLITVIGVRFTTARMTAEQTLDQVSRVLGRSLRASKTTTLPLAGGDIADVTAFIDEARHASGSIDAASLTRLARSYGTAYPRVVAILESEPMLRASLGEACAITGAEVQYAMREEMAVHLADVLLRRTEAGSAAHPGRDAVQACAAIMAREYRWDAARIAAEIDTVEERYRLR
jgi:glycerol-3-phosphate dehydrogenase